jgi:plasmid stability protein
MSDKVEPIRPRTVDQNAAEKLEKLIEAFRKWLWLPDAGAVITALAAVTANRMAGDPVWLLIVGPGGSGKTEIVQSLDSIPRVYLMGGLTEAGLLSATPQRFRTKDCSGGLLNEVGDGGRGVALIKDFGSILSIRYESQLPVLQALREIYDGSWTRNVGVDGGKTLRWHGKLGLVGGVTPIIDRYHGVMNTLGERFLFYRMAETTSEERKKLARAAMHHTGYEDEMRHSLKKAVASWIEDLRLPASGGELEAADSEFLVNLSSFVAVARTAVDRDYHSRQVDLVPPPEAPGRLSCGLSQLYRAMVAIGVPALECRKLISRVGFDSMPALRSRIISFLALTASESAAGIARSVKHPRTTVTRTLEELEVHSIVECDQEWRLSDWARVECADLLFE